MCSILLPDNILYEILSFYPIYIYASSRCIFINVVFKKLDRYKIYVSTTNLLNDTEANILLKDAAIYGCNDLINALIFNMKNNKYNLKINIPLLSLAAEYGNDDSIDILIKYLQ